MTVIDLSAVNDKDLATAVLNHVAENNRARVADGIPTVVEEVSPNGPECRQIKLKDGETETSFWMQFVTDLLCNDDWMDQFKGQFGN